MEETIKIKGQVRVEVRDSEGNLLQDTGFEPNVITTLGKAAIAGLVGNTGSQTAFTYLALGTSSTAPAAADTTLGTEITDSGLGRSTSTVSRVQTTTANDTVQFVKTWTATGSKTVTEAGVLNASSAGVLLAHKLLSPSIAVISGNTLTVTYQVSFA